MDGKLWQVCELQEHVRSFIELSVAAVPEMWVVQLEDGSYICYWPKDNASKKIRSFASPKDGGRWTNYKCRILMEGEKFSSYEEARQAEKDAQDVSSTVDTSKVLNSTMDFDVSNTDVETDVEEPDVEDSDVEESDVEDSDVEEPFVEDSDIGESVFGETDDESSDHISTMNFDASDAIEENDEEMVGNDSTEFNKAVLLGGSYCSNNNVMDAAAAFDLSSESCYSASNMSVKSDYSNRFGAGNDFLTSTTIAETNVLNIADAETILSSIKALEVNVMALCKDLKQDLQDIKEISSRKSETVNVDEDQTKQHSVQISDYNQAVNEMIYVGGDTGENSLSCIKKNEDQVMDNRVDDYIVISVGDGFQVNSPSVHEQFIANDEMNLNEKNEELHLPQPIPIAPTVPNDETFDLNLPKQIKMKINEEEEFRQNEDLLELDEEMESKLVNDLLPLRGETEAAYIKRTVGKLFAPNFFLRSITWKPEKDRVCIKHTNTLKCWKVSFGTVFGSDEKNEKYITHFRRLKSAMRAAEKAAKRAASSGTKGTTLSAGAKKMKLTCAEKKQA